MTGNTNYPIAVLIALLLIALVYAWLTPSSAITAQLPGDVELAAEADSAPSPVLDGALSEAHERILSEANERIASPQYAETIAFLKSAEARVLQEEGWQSPVLPHLWFRLGRIAQIIGQLDTAEHYLQKALDVLSIQEAADKQLTANIYNVIGIVLGTKRFYDDAAAHFLLALETARQISAEDTRERLIGSSYTNLGNIFYHKGDFHKSARYHEYALRQYAAQLEPNHPDLAIPYNNLALCAEGVERYEQAREFNQLALNIRLQGYVRPNESVADSYYNLGESCSAAGDHLAALAHYAEALAIRTELYKGKDHPDMADTYRNMGVTHLCQGSPQQAVHFLEQALPIYQRTLGLKHPETALCYQMLGRAYFELEDAAAAAASFQKALAALNYSSSGAIAGLSSRESAVEILRHIGALEQHRYRRTADEARLDSAHQAYLQALKVAEAHLRSISPDSKSNFARKAHPVFEGGLLTSYWLHDIRPDEGYAQAAFELNERSKAMILLEAMQEAGALKLGGIAPELLEQEYQLRLEKARYDRQRQELLAQGADVADPMLLEVNARMLALDQDLESLYQNLEAQYPRYHQLKNPSGVISATAAQQQLLRDGAQALIEYFVGDSVIFIFTLLPDRLHFHEIKRDFPLDPWVQELRCALAAGHVRDGRCPSLESAAARQQYAERAHQLYEKIFAPIAALLPTEGALIIVPDGVLGYLPFEALLTNAPQASQDFHEYPYLLHAHAISYAYSATMQREMQDKRHLRSPAKSLLACAPTFESSAIEADSALFVFRFSDFSDYRDRLAPLRFNIPEAQSIAAMVGGETLLGAAATRAAFAERAGDYRILHLSTHGKANDMTGDLSFLAFHRPVGDSTAQDWLYYNRDLYNLQLNADLVVLSACETGLGELQRGEGIISLARGFSFAGAKSIVTSLWNVNDQSAMVLMEYFYGHLKKGLPKQQALRQAKLDYLENHPNLGQSPFFWAAFIPIGDMAPVDFPSPWRPLWPWALSIAFVALLVWRWKS
jgi:CHAT domain-containing protein/Tfp pilus assembly protein PilF